MTLLRQLTAGAPSNNKTLCCFRALGINKKIKTNIIFLKIQVSIHGIVGSMNKNSFCSYRGPKFGFQHPHWAAPKHVTLVTGDPVPSGLPSKATAHTQNKS